MDGQKSTSAVVLIALVVALAAGYGGYVYGQKSGQQAAFDAGYQKAQADVKAQQEELAKKAAEEAAKAANPFQAKSNPLQGVADPLEKTKKVLNPF